MEHKVEVEISEVAKKKESICNGCSNNCRYCSTREIKSRLHSQSSDWATEQVDVMKAFNTGYRKVRDNDPSTYDIVFPTTHDITLNTLGASLAFLKKVLVAGNTVLIITKPNPVCIQALTMELAPWKSQIHLRLSITAMDEGLLKYWEPNAPSFQQRFIALKDCFNKGFKTSVNIEPALDIPNLPVLVDTVMPFVTDKIWIGKMNHANRCVVVETEEDRVQLERILNSQEDLHFWNLYHKLKSNPKIGYNDSMRTVINPLIEKQQHKAQTDSPLPKESVSSQPEPVEISSHGVVASDFAFELLKVFSERQAAQFQQLQLIEDIVAPFVSSHPELQKVNEILKTLKPKSRNGFNLN